MVRTSPRAPPPTDAAPSEALAGGLLKEVVGATPKFSMAAMLYTDVKGRGVFVKPDAGKFGLSEWRADAMLSHLVVRRSESFNALLHVASQML